MTICSPCSGDFAYAKRPCMDYKYSFTDDTSCVLGFQKLQCSRNLQECLTNSQKYLGTFQLFIHVLYRLSSFITDRSSVQYVLTTNYKAYCSPMETASCMYATVCCLNNIIIESYYYLCAENSPFKLLV